MDQNFSDQGLEDLASYVVCPYITDVNVKIGLSLIETKKTPLTISFTSCHKWVIDPSNNGIYFHDKNNPNNAFEMSFSIIISKTNEIIPYKRSEYTYSVDKSQHILEYSFIPNKSSSGKHCVIVLYINGTEIAHTNDLFVIISRSTTSKHKRKAIQTSIRDNDFNTKEITTNNNLKVDATTCWYDTITLCWTDKIPNRSYTIKRKNNYNKYVFLGVTDKYMYVDTKKLKSGIRYEYLIESGDDTINVSCRSKAETLILTPNKESEEGGYYVTFDTDRKVESDINNMILLFDDQEIPFTKEDNKVSFVCPPGFEGYNAKVFLTPPEISKENPLGYATFKYVKNNSTKRDSSPEEIAKKLKNIDDKLNILISKQ